MQLIEHHERLNGRHVSHGQLAQLLEDLSFLEGRPLPKQRQLRGGVLGFDEGVEVRVVWNRLGRGLPNSGCSSP